MIKVLVPANIIPKQYIVDIYIYNIYICILYIYMRIIYMCPSLARPFRKLSKGSVVTVDEALLVYTVSRLVEQSTPATAKLSDTYAVATNLPRGCL